MNFGPLSCDTLGATILRGGLDLEPGPSGAEQELRPSSAKQDTSQLENFRFRGKFSEQTELSQAGVSTRGVG